MKLIVITQEHSFNSEADAVNRLFEAGLKLLHVRKPNFTEEEMAYFLQKIDKKYHPFIVLHDHFQLAMLMNIKGIHLNRRNSVIPIGFHGSKSFSCHDIAMLTRYPDMDYLFLSPIFDSISKEGYKANFSKNILLQAKQKNIINERIIALGGITDTNILQIKELGFGGTAVLGYLWADFSESHDDKALITRFQKLKNRIENEL